MKALRDLEIFHQAADTGSLSEAARRLELTPAAASAALKRLEEELGVPLFLRSTRSLRLTDEGRVFLEHSRQAMQLLIEGQEAALGGSADSRGVLQLSLPSDLGRNVLLPWLDEFQAINPGLQLRLLLSDHLADFYRQPLDLTLRYGKLPDSGLVALPIAPANQRILCASPGYIRRHGAPASPLELTGLNCLCYMLSEYVHDRWRFTRDGQEMTVQVTGDRIADDGDAVRRWAVAGEGIAYKSALDVAGDLAAGRLIRLCPDWRGETVPLNLVCSDRRRISPMVQKLREFLSRQCTALAATAAAHLG
jgi:DNA-binding transcriptional LysR family regulator